MLKKLVKLLKITITLADLLKKAAEALGCRTGSLGGPDSAGGIKKDPIKRV